VTLKKIALTVLAIPALLSAMVLLTAAKKPAPTSFEALVVKLDGTSVLLSAADEKHFKQVAVETDSKTQVLVAGKVATLADLKPGQRVIVSPPKGTAARIEQKTPRHGKTPESGLLDGAMVSAGSGRVTFLSPQSNGEIAQIEAATSDKTVVMIDGKPTSPADLKAGQYVVIAFTGGSVRRIVVQSAKAE
jgi:3-dehydroquinate synthase class II